MTDRGQPRFISVPRLWGKFSGITLPPVGIFLERDRFEDSKLRAHELVHWEQYQRWGLLGYYTRYLAGWVRVGFRYRRIPMEREARGEITLT